MSPRNMCFVVGMLALVQLTIQGQAISLRKYVATSHENNVWPRFIYKTVAFNRKPFVSK